MTEYSPTWPMAEDIWPLVRSGRHNEAREIFTSLCCREAKTDAEFDKRASIALCLGDWDQAYQDLRKLHEATSLRKGQLHVGIYLSEIGVVEWLRGNQGEAKRLWRAHVDGLRDRIIQYSDPAGGVKPGCFLWFGGVMTQDRNSVEYAVRYLKRLAKRSRIEYWPGPVAMLILDTISFEKTIERASTRSPLIAEPAGPQPELLTRRHVCETLFYGAIKSFACSDIATYSQRLRSCSELENPIIELEWYLARNELQRIGKSQSMG